jgi:hypothetical protein
MLGNLRRQNETTVFRKRRSHTRSRLTVDPPFFGKSSASILHSLWFYVLLDVLPWSLIKCRFRYACFAAKVDNPANIATLQYIACRQPWSQYIAICRSVRIRGIEHFDCLRFGNVE